VLLVPIGVLAAAELIPGPQADALHPWVYLLVYGCFAAQGALLGAAFVRYAQDRWAPAFGRCQRDPATGPTRGRQHKASLGAAALATAIAGFFIVWASGMPLGRDPVTIRGQSALQACPSWCSRCAPLPRPSGCRCWCTGDRGRPGC
jgi:hypothetical protein